MNTAGQNISNAETEGYNRRQISLKAESTPSGSLLNGHLSPQAAGTGVAIDQVERVQSQLLSRAHQNATTGKATAEENHRLLRTVESLFTTENGSLNERLSSFWNSWDNLANHPTDRSARLNVRSKAQGLTDTLNRLDNGLDRTKESVKTDLQNTVAEVNDLLEQIAQTNQQLGTAKAGGSADLTAQDKRDQLIGQLAEKLPVTVHNDKDELMVQVNGVSVVQGNESTTLELENLSSSPTVRFTDADITYSPPSSDEGVLGAQLKMLNQTLPSVEKELTQFTNTLAKKVNSLHNGATKPDGTTAGDFFQMPGPGQEFIGLHKKVAANADEIAAAGSGKPPGDNTVALQISDLQTTKLFNNGRETPQTFATNIISNVGEQVQAAERQVRTTSAAADHAKALKESVTGVSLNEEMTNLVKFQQGYAAAAKVVQTARTLSDTLFSAY